MNPPSDATELSFEEAFARLEDVVKALEAGGLTVEQSVRLYEHGIELARICNRRLDQAELRVQTLQYDEPPTGDDTL